MTILRLPDVKRRTGLCKTRIYALEKSGEFPARLELGPNSVGWYEHEVEEWNANRRRRLTRREDGTQTSAP